MRLDFKQLPLGEWTAGPIRTSAKLRMEPGQLSRLLGIRFSETEDDFDRLKAAYLRVRGRPFLLLKRANDPAAGTELQVRSSPENARSALVQFLHGVGLSADHVEWSLDAEPNAGRASRSEEDFQGRKVLSAKQARNLRRIESPMSHAMWSSHDTGRGWY